MTSNLEKTVNRQRELIRWRFLIAAVLAFGAVGELRAQAGMSAAQVAARVDRHYNALHSLEVHFVQTYTGLGMTRKESGLSLIHI